jgi:hypothetical protein
MLLLLTVSLTAYAFDCGPATTPAQAMQCCDSMQCSSHGHHGQDCCKTMPTMHAPYVGPASVPSVSFSSVVLAVRSAPGAPETMDFSVGVIAAHCHAPPILSVPTPLPLRI